MIDLNLYPKFRADIDSPVVSIHYIMIIGWDRLDLNETSVGSPVENSIYLSQKKERFDGVYYQDYDLKIPSINEIHDFRDNKYKINNISVTLSNYQTHQTRFSDLLQDRTFLNNTVMIFYKSNSCETLADCLPIYCGVIKNLKHDDKKVSVSVEDFTEKYLDTKVPVHYMGKDASGSVPDKYLTSPIPMTFGAVDFAKVPFSTNIFNGDETVKIRLYVDSQEIDDLEDDVFNVGSVQLEHTPIYIFDNHFYILEDKSGVFSPDVWIKRAIELYYKFDADRIVCEVNNGGDLIEKLLRVQDVNVPYSSVRATRGKMLRAEPISALYEQGKVHHVGYFKELEEQMCSYTPDTIKSPDRLDALVWGITSLMNSGKAIFRIS